MATWSVSNATAVLKRLYPKGVSEVLAPQCQAFARLRKDKEAMLGEGRYVVVKHAGGAGVSADITKAIANKSPGSYARFFVQPFPEYAAASIDGRLINRAKNSAALVDAIADQTENLIYAIGRSIAVHLYGDGTGTRGEIATGSDVTTDTITLTEPDDALKFEVGMKVQLWDGSSASVRDSGKTVTIEAIDPDNGTITATTAWNTITGATIGDKLVLEGDFMNVATGFAGWLPTTAPGSTDNFFGVNRSVAPHRLAGLRVNGSGGQIDEVLIEAANKLMAYGGRPDLCFVNYQDFNDIALARSSYTQVKDGTNTSQLGFESFKIMGPRGVIEVVPDADCPRGRAYLLTSSTWTIGSANDLPHIIADDGGNLVRSASDDSFEIRLRGDWNLYCNAPGHNAVITF